MSKTNYEKINLPKQLETCVNFFYSQEDWNMIQSSNEEGVLPMESYTEEELRSAYQRGIISKCKKEDNVEYVIAGYDERIGCLIQCEQQLWKNTPKEIRDQIAKVMMDPTTWLQQRLDALAAGIVGPETVSPVEEAIKLIEEADGIVTARACDCFMYLEGCDRDKSDVCIHVLPKEPVLNSSLDRGICKEITKEEAIEIIKRTDRDGLVHSLMPNGMCNCCVCCCYNLKNADEYPIKDNLLLTPYRAFIDEGKCVGCKMCMKKCQFSALSLKNGVMKVDHELCWGCGVCRTICNRNAIHMEKIV